MSGPLRVAICHDDLVRAGLSAMLAPYAPDIEVVRRDGDDEDAPHVDIAVCDAYVTDPDAPGFAADLRHVCNADRIVVFGWSRTAAAIERALAAGAVGYLGMEVTAEDLVLSLEQVAAGQVVVQGVRTGGAEETWPGRAEGLSLRESQIVALVARGLSNRQVADRVYLSINTVKVHIRRAYRSMAVTSRSQAVLWAVDHGFNHDVVVGEPAESTTVSA